MKTFIRLVMVLGFFTFLSPSFAEESATPTQAADAPTEMHDCQHCKDGNCDMKKKKHSKKNCKGECPHHAGAKTKTEQKS